VVAFVGESLVSLPGIQFRLGILSERSLIL